VIKLTCKKFQSEYKIFKDIINDIMEERKNGISEFSKKEIEFEKKEFERLENEVLL